MTQNIKKYGISRLQEAVENLENKLQNAVVAKSGELSDSARCIDTEILKALKSENDNLKKQNSTAKKQIDLLITDLQAKL